MKKIVPTFEEFLNESNQINEGILGSTEKQVKQIITDYAEYPFEINVWDYMIGEMIGSLKGFMKFSKKKSEDIANFYDKAYISLYGKSAKKKDPITIDDIPDAVQKRFEDFGNKENVESWEVVPPSKLKGAEKRKEYKYIQIIKYKQPQEVVEYPKTYIQNYIVFGYTDNGSQYRFSTIPANVRKAHPKYMNDKTLKRKLVK